MEKNTKSIKRIKWECTVSVGAGLDAERRVRGLRWWVSDSKVDGVEGVSKGVVEKNHPNIILSANNHNHHLGDLLQTSIFQHTEDNKGFSRHTDVFKGVSKFIYLLPDIQDPTTGLKNTCLYLADKM